MEDSHIANLDLGYGMSFFGVYDGHGGKYTISFQLKILFKSNDRGIGKNVAIALGNEVAEYVRDHLIDELKKLSSF